MNLLKTLQEWVDPEIDENKDFGMIPRKEYYDKDKHLIKKTSFVDHNEAVRRYTGDVSDVLNKMLWETKLYGNSALGYYHKSYRDHVTDVNNNIKNISYDEPLNVYTGVRHGDTPNNLKEGNIVHIPAFISSSTNPNIAHEFSTNSRKSKVSHILKIHIPANSDSGAYINEVSRHKDEHEFLIPHNKLLRIGKSYIYNDSDGNHITMHDAHIMDDHEIQANKDHPEVQSYLKMKDILK